MGGMDSGDLTGGGGGAANAGLGANAPPPFLSKTYDMVDDPSTDAIVSWGPANNSFVVWSTPEFARDLLPKYFKHNNFSSFVRQLNTYGFRKVDPDRWEFANEGFLRGQKHLLKNINRRKPSHAHNQQQQPPSQSASVAACVEVGKFGLEEEIERLKRDKNVLMQELVRLRQQQQSTDHQLQTLGQRLQGMEQRQQQMMSFLAKAMHSPGFLAQLVQQNDSSRRITGVNKKRRLPRQEGSAEGESSPDGQIIKFQPLINEAAKAMLMQILKFDSAPQMEPVNNSDSLLIENFPVQPETLDSRSSSSRNSGVTLAEVPPSSGIPPPPFVSVSSGFSTAVSSSSAVSDGIQSSFGVTDVVTAGPTDMSVLSSVPQAIPCEFPEMQDLVPDANAVDMPGENFALAEGENGYIDNPIAMGLDGTVPIELEKFPSDTDIDLFNSDEGQKLPGIIDSFWEQFLTASPLSGDTEQVDSGILETKDMGQPAVENGWDNGQSMDNLTEQMGLLTSKSKV